jgi:hypothetical protein
MKTVFFIIGTLLFSHFSAVAFTKLENGVSRSDGTPGDTQRAINAARPGSIVQIPNGSYTWTSGITINKPIHLAGESVGGVTITNSSNIDGILLITEARNGSIEISGLKLVCGTTTGSNKYHHMRVLPGDGGKPVLLHDCYFEANGSTIVYSIEWCTNGGVIWKCEFASGYNYLGGIQFKHFNDFSWTKPSTMGMADVNGTANTYVEDCKFTGMFIGCTDFDDDSRTVIRHCTIDNCELYSHGQDTSPDGARHWEVYDNTFIYTASGSPPGFSQVAFPLNLQCWFVIRGGTGVIADNVFPNISTKNLAIQMNVYSINRFSNSIPCQTRYPAPRQLGQTWIGKGGYAYPDGRNDGSGYAADPIYIWGNTGTATESPTFVGLNQYAPDECGHGQKISDYVKEGRDYILNKAKPGYVKFTYPHPLRVAVEAERNHVR